MENLIRLYNRSPRQVALNVRGQQFTMEGFEEKAFEESVGRLFVAQHGGVVVQAESVGGVVKPVEKPKTMWLANLTGDPDAPAEIRQKVWRGKNAGWVVEKVPNANARPQELHEEINGSWIEFTTKDGFLGADKGPPIHVILPPYKRIEVPDHVGRTFLTRGSAAAVRDVNGVVYPKCSSAAEPSPDEPDDSWSLDDLTAWLTYVDPSAIVESSEEKIRKQKGAAKNPHKADFEVAEAKRRTLKRIYFAIVARKVKVPPLREFREYMGRMKPEHEEVSELAEKVLAEAVAE